MKMPILDIDKLKQIDLRAVAKYLESNGWTQSESSSESDCSLWQYSFRKNQKALALLPLDPETPDFSTNLSDLIRMVSVVEKRSPIDVFHSLQAASKTAEAGDSNSQPERS